MVLPQKIEFAYTCDSEDAIERLSAPQRLELVYDAAARSDDDVVLARTGTTPSTASGATASTDADGATGANGLDISALQLQEQDRTPASFDVPSAAQSCPPADDAYGTPARAALPPKLADLAQVTARVEMGWELADDPPLSHIAPAAGDGAGDGESLPVEMEVGSSGPTAARRAHEAYDAIALRDEGEDGLSIAQRRNRRTWVRNARLAVLAMQADVNKLLTDRLEREKEAFARNPDRVDVTADKTLARAKGKRGKAAKAKVPAGDEDDDDE